MTLNHLILSIMIAIYIAFGKNLEEKDLINNFGNKYIEYMRQVNSLLPSIKKYKK